MGLRSFTVVIRLVKAVFRLGREGSEAKSPAARMFQKIYGIFSGSAPDRVRKNASNTSCKAPKPIFRL
jgi:hypothetical protein